GAKSRNATSAPRKRNLRDFRGSVFGSLISKAPSTCLIMRQICAKQKVSLDRRRQGQARKIHQERRRARSARLAS
ncbi:MAG: hypothetical protein ACLPNY_01255, partial [Roseiarcus sp.]